MDRIFFKQFTTRYCFCNTYVCWGLGSPGNPDTVGVYSLRKSKTHPKIPSNVSILTVTDKMQEKGENMTSQRCNDGCPCVYSILSHQLQLPSSSSSDQLLAVPSPPPCFPSSPLGEKRERGSLALPSLFLLSRSLTSITTWCVEVFSQRQFFQEGKQKLLASELWGRQVALALYLFMQDMYMEWFLCAWLGVPHEHNRVFALKGKGSRKEIKHANYNSVPALSVGEVRIPLTAFNSNKSQSKSIHGHSLAVLPRAWVQSLVTTPKLWGMAKKKKKKIISLQNTKSVWR